MAKFLLKSKGVGAVLDSHKQFHQIVVKTDPALTNVSAALLKWAGTESNLSMFDAFSAWSDLNHALVVLSSAVNKQLFAFHQTFKNIQGEEKNLAKLRANAENASKRVRQANMKLESAKKVKKKDQIKIDNCESELTLAMGTERERLMMLSSKEEEFESNKAVWVKQILRSMSGSYIEYLEKSLKVWKVKQSIAEAMADEPVSSAGNLHTDSHRKVSTLFKEFSIDLPPRETPDIKKTRTMPNQVSTKTDMTSLTLPPNRAKCYMQSVASDVDGDEQDYNVIEEYLPIGGEEVEDATPPSPQARELPRSATSPQLSISISTFPKPPSSPPPQSPPPRPPPGPASTMSQSDETSSSCSSNISESKPEPIARRGLKVFPDSSNAAVRLKPSLVKMLSQPPEGSSTPDSGGEDPSSGQLSQRKSLDVLEAFRRNGYPDQQSSPPPQKRPVKPVNKGPALLPKPGRPPKPTLNKPSSSNNPVNPADTARAVTEHEYCIPPNEDDQVDDPHDRRQSWFLQNNNFQQVTESDSDCSDDYEWVDGRR